MEKTVPVPHVLEYVQKYFQQPVCRTITTWLAITKQQRHTELNMEWDEGFELMKN